MTLYPPFGRTSQASSASFFSQVEIPLGLALRLYDAFSAAVQRMCTCSVARSLAYYVMEKADKVLGVTSDRCATKGQEWRNCSAPECKINCRCGWPDNCLLYNPGGPGY